MITENLSTLKIHKLTQAQYDRELVAGNIDENALYLTPDEGANIELDTTLAQSGMAADAKAVGEAIALKADQEFVNEINERIPELDDELRVLGAAADAAAVGEALDIKANKTDIPTTLPNPYILTIKGVSYDGSKAVTIDVADGKDGYTPIKGTDYWTEEDKQEIKTYVDGVIAGIEEALAEI